MVGRRSFLLGCQPIDFVSGECIMVFSVLWALLTAKLCVSKLLMAVSFLQWPLIVEPEPLPTSRSHTISILQGDSRMGLVWGIGVQPLRVYGISLHWNKHASGWLVCVCVQKRSLQVRVVFNIHHFHVGGRVLEILHKTVLCGTLREASRFCVFLYSCFVLQMTSGWYDSLCQWPGVLNLWNLKITPFEKESHVPKLHSCVPC